MKKLITSLLTLSTITMAQAADLSFLKSDAPIAQKDNQELYMYSGDFGKETKSPFKCWVLLQVKKGPKGQEIIGVNNMNFNYLNLDLHKGVWNLYSKAKQVSKSQIHMTITDYISTKTTYDFNVDSTNGNLDSYKISHHDRATAAILQGDAIEDFEIKCNNLKNISRESEVTEQIWGHNYALKNIAKFNNK